MSESTYMQKVVPEPSDTQVLGRGALVFLSGMAVAAASFLVERAVMRAIQRG